MKADEILQSNKLIAEFMELPFKNREWDERGVFLWSDNYWRTPEKLKYHSSWDWLIPVVEKIEEISDYRVSIEGLECEVFTFLRSNSIATRHIVAERVGESKIEGVYLTVIDFIKWHDENPK